MHTFINLTNSYFPCNEYTCETFSVKDVYREYVYSVAVYKKYLTRFGELIILELWRENYHFSQPS